MENIIYDCRWSDEVDDKFIEDFISIQNQVFKCGYTEDLFIKKYVKNIYGKSVVVVVYIDNKPEGARGLWRNDINDKEAYQPGDTCVTEACRGKGIFSEMTKRSVAMLPEDAIVYNFPNKNSYPGYIKIGWKLVNEYNMRLFTSAKKYFREHPIKMDNAYADWWINGDNSMFYYKWFGVYFLVRPFNKKLCYKICACVSENTAKNFKKIPFGVFFYRSSGASCIKMGAPVRVVSKYDNIDCIPLWKMDVI